MKDIGIAMTIVSSIVLIVALIARHYDLMLQDRERD